MKANAFIKTRSFIPVHTTTSQGEVAIVTLHPGSLTYPKSIQEFGQEIQEYAAARPGVDVIVDFHHVHHISSSVLNHLLELKHLVESRGGSLRICGLHQNGRELFALTKLDHLFCLYPDLRHALRHYSEGASQTHRNRRNTRIMNGGSQ